MCCFGFLADLKDEEQVLANDQVWPNLLTKCPPQTSYRSRDARFQPVFVM